MKKVVQRVLEAGLVDKHVAQMMEKWGTLDQGASELVGRQDVRKMSKTQLEQFAEELATELEKEEDAFRQTRLDIGIQKMRVLHFYAMPCFIEPVVEDELGRFILVLEPKSKLEVMRGMRVEDKKLKAVGHILEFETLYRGEQPYALQLTVEWEPEPLDV